MLKRSFPRVAKFRATLWGTFFPKTEEQKQQEAEERKKLLVAQRNAAERRSRTTRAAKERAIKNTATLSAVVLSSSSKITGKRNQPENDTSVHFVKRRSERGVEYVLKNVTPFNDTIPSRYPNRYCTRPPKWEGSQGWVRLLAIPPHRCWSAHLRVMHPEPWLQGMGVPKKHRSHLFLSKEDVEWNHHAVFYHAALQAARQPAVANNPLYDSGTSIAEDADSRATRIACQYPDLSQEYLAACRERVLRSGFCVIEGIFDDRNVPRRGQSTIYQDNPTSQVMAFYMKQFPSKQDLNKDGENKFWNPTFNSTSDVQEHVKRTGHGLFISTREGLFEHVEQNDSTVEIARCRAALDIRALQICIAMGLEEVGSQMLAIPSTGCRLYTSTPNSERQIPHTDYNASSDDTASFIPKHSVDYTVIWTAEDPYPLVLWEYSHILQCGMPMATKKIAQTAHAKRVMIPPFSCIVLRGDLLYAGPGWRDLTTTEKKSLKHPRPFRFQLHVLRWGMKKVERENRFTDVPVVPDSISFLNNFQPSVQPNPVWITRAR